MKRAYNRTRRYCGVSGWMYDDSSVGELDQPLLAEIGAQCCVDSPIDLVAHVAAITRVVTDARRKALNDRGRRRTLGQVSTSAASEGDRL